MALIGLVPNGISFRPFIREQRQERKLEVIRERATAEIKDALVNDIQNVFQSSVRAIISLAGHAGAVCAIIYLTTTDGDGDAVSDIPEWLTAIFALVITWYFATRERGDEQLPTWQAILRGSVRAVHAVGGAGALAFLFINGNDIPPWWVAIYSSILVFYFIENRDPPKVRVKAGPTV